MHPARRLFLRFLAAVIGAPRLYAQAEIPAVLDTRFDTSHLDLTGRILSMAVQTDGRVLIAGQFRILGSAPRTNIARLEADGTVDDGFVASTSLSDRFGGSAAAV